MFRKLLIANRGEIACRIQRTAQRLGIATVAVYSDADRNALHVQLANEAVFIGGSAPSASYLDIGAVLAAARRAGADAIHPGYGFLSENPAFCRSCTEAGLAFIGPPAAAIECMGSKSAAKRTAEAAGIPVVPGYHGDDQRDATLHREARSLGYPVLLKAVAGGGGTGMRVVECDTAFQDTLRSARREALTAFGDDRMLLEKYLDRPRHVEVQVFCDTLGGGVFLFDRDCSIQRRHQKIIEEAPAPGLEPALRQRMGELAVTAARAIDYVGAGTVEFLVDSAHRFYFMEMNTRLQVEHGVTELISDVDLVEWQLRVAAGEPLPLAQSALCHHGHAIEARIYAEDPARDFLPVAGHIGLLRAPATDNGLRIDTGIRQGDEVSIFYDPMIAKLMAWGETREQALHRLGRALADYQIGGLPTNLPFLRRLVQLPAMASGEVDTGFISGHHAALFQAPRHHPAWLPLAALYLTLIRQPAADPEGPVDPWQAGDGWRLNLPRRELFRLRCDGVVHEVALIHDASMAPDEVLIDDHGSVQRCRGRLNGNALQAELDGHRLRACCESWPGGYSLFIDGAGTVDFSVCEPDIGDIDASHRWGELTAPMNGRVVSLLVSEGATVDLGQALLVIEAMKMEHTLRAPRQGVVARLTCREGDLVDDGAQLLELTEIAQE